MVNAPAFQFYPKDYLASARVAEMTLEEEGAYCRALFYCWQHGSIPADPERLARVVGKGASGLVATVVQKMFFLDPDDTTKMLHDRLEQEREKQQAWREKSAKGGRASKGKPKKRKEKVEQQGGMQMVGDCLQPNEHQNNTLQSSSASALKETKVSSRQKMKGSRIPEEFRPSNKVLDWAKTQLPGADMENRIKEFKNYWETKTGRDATKLDWNKTFENRIIQIAEWNNRNGNGKSATPINRKTAREYIAELEPLQ